MKNRTNDLLSEMERDILQEVMNIAFGQAAAELEEVMDVSLVLSVPRIRLIEAMVLPQYLEKEVVECMRGNVVQQAFQGRTRGLALLIFPQGSEKEFLSLFDQEIKDEPSSHLPDDMAKELLMEIGNILIGACAGKLYELLNDAVTYMPPWVVKGECLSTSLLKRHFNSSDWAIVLETFFRFEEKNITGHLFLINSQDSMATMRQSLRDFMGRYE